MRARITSVALALTLILTGCSSTKLAFVEETFSLLLAGLGIEEDTGFETMEDIMSDVE